MWLMTGIALAAPHVDLAAGYAVGAVHPMELESEGDQLILFDWGHGTAGRLAVGWLLEERFDAVLGVDWVASEAEGWTDGADVPAPGQLLRLSGHLRLPYWPAERLRPYLVLGMSLSHYGEAVEPWRLAPAADGGAGVEWPARVSPFVEADGSWYVARYAIEEAQLSLRASRYPLVPNYPAVRAVAGVRVTPDR